MKEISPSPFQAKLQETTSQEIVEVLQGMKQIAFLLRLKASDKSTFEYLFRFEDAIKLTLDPRIPKPQELYRDIAFHRISSILDWNITIPVERWRFEGMKGVIRPYFREARTVVPYNIKQKVDIDSFLIKSAILDYICGVVDRTYNDILIVNNVPYLVDSGLSFVDGTNFVYENSQIREISVGHQIPQTLLDDISSLNYKNVFKKTSPFLKHAQVLQILKRKEILLNKKLII